MITKYKDAKSFSHHLPDVWINLQEMQNWNLHTILEKISGVLFRLGLVSCSFSCIYNFCIFLIDFKVLIVKQMFKGKKATLSKTFQCPPILLELKDKLPQITYKSLPDLAPIIELTSTPWTPFSLILTFMLFLKSTLRLLSLFFYLTSLTSNIHRTYPFPSPWSLFKYLHTRETLLTINIQKNNSNF